MNHAINPLISLITSTLNARDHLPHLAESLRLQAYANFEWIVIDGGSTDGTQNLLAATTEVTHWVSEPDNGIYDAWNKGLARAQGDWIVFVGADDRLTPNAVNALLTAAKQSSTQPDYVSGRVVMTRKGMRVKTIGRPWSWNIFRHYMCVAHTASMHHRSYFERYGKFDTSFRISGDYELLLRAGSGLRTAYTDTVVAHSEVGGRSNSDATVFLENLRAKRQHRSVGRFLAYAFIVRAWGMWRLRRLIHR